MPKASVSTQIKCFENQLQAQGAQGEANLGTRQPPNILLALQISP